MKFLIAEEFKATFSKSIQTEFQNDFSTLSNENLEFQNSRFLFFKQNILNLPQDLRHIINRKARTIWEAKK